MLPRQSISNTPYSVLARLLPGAGAVRYIRAWFCAAAAGFAAALFIVSWLDFARGSFRCLRRYAAASRCRYAAEPPSMLPLPPPRLRHDVFRRITAYVESVLLSPPPFDAALSSELTIFRRRRQRRPGSLHVAHFSRWHAPDIFLQAEQRRDMRRCASPSGAATPSSRRAGVAVLSPPFARYYAKMITEMNIARNMRRAASIFSPPPTAPRHVALLCHAERGAYTSEAAFAPFLPRVLRSCLLRRQRVCAHMRNAAILPPPPMTRYAMPMPPNRAIRHIMFSQLIDRWPCHFIH